MYDVISKMRDWRLDSVDLNKMITPIVEVVKEA